MIEAATTKPKVCSLGGLPISPIFTLALNAFRKKEPDKSHNRVVLRGFRPFFSAPDPVNSSPPKRLWLAGDNDQ